MIGRCDEDDAYKRGLVATEEHITPRQMGGTDEPINLMIACARCNNLRDTVPFDAFMPFARTVIQKFPDAPIRVLRVALKQYLMDLVAVGSKNHKALNRACSLSLLCVVDALDER